MPDGEQHPLVSGVEEFLAKQRDRGERTGRVLEFLPLDYLKDYPPRARPVAIEGILRVGDLAIITGSYDTFKSMFALELAYVLATGDDFLGRFPVRRRLRMGLLQAEIDPGSYAERLQVFVRTPELVICSDLHFDFDRLGELAEAIEDYGLDGIVLDPLGPMWPSYARNGEPFSENAKTHVTPVLKALKSLHRTVILVHHDPSPAATGPRKRGSGSTALMNDPDARIALDRNDPLVGVTVRNRLQSPAGTFYVKFIGRRLRYSHANP